MHPAYSAALDRLLEITVLLHADMSRGLGDLGLTASRTQLLWRLWALGPCTQRVLADELGVSARNVTGLVDALVETGFVTREPHPDDRRARLVTFTEHGRRVMEAMERDHQAFTELLFANLSDDQLSCLVSGLDVVLERLRTIPDAQPVST